MSFSRRLQRTTGIAALGDLGDLSAALPLRALVADRDDRTVRYAIEALTALKDTLSVPAIAAALLGRSKDLADSAAKALVVIGDDSAKNAVLSVFRDRKAKDGPRQAVADAVGKASQTYLKCLAAVSDQLSAVSFRRPSGRPLKCLREVSALRGVTSFLYRSCQGLSKQESKANWATSAVAAVALDEQDRESVRMSAGWALGQIGGAEAVAALQKAALSKNKKVQARATHALNQMKSQ